jgi:hypothetical protein
MIYRIIGLLLLSFTMLPSARSQPAEVSKLDRLFKAFEGSWVAISNQKSSIDILMAAEGTWLVGWQSCAIDEDGMKLCGQGKEIFISKNDLVEKCEATYREQNWQCLGSTAAAQIFEISESKIVLKFETRSGNQATLQSFQILENGDLIKEDSTLQSTGEQLTKTSIQFQRN